MAENFIWLALPNDDASVLLAVLESFYENAVNRNHITETVATTIRRLERQINGV